MLEDGKEAQLHLQPAVEVWLTAGRNPLNLYLYTEQVDELARVLNERMNATGPGDKPWGMYEFALSDPDETLVRIDRPTRLRNGNAD